MIPANIDHLSIVRDLNAWGWRDYKIEVMCGFSTGYLAHLKSGKVKQMVYQRAARLYNFWWSEHEAHVSRGTESAQCLVETT